MEIVSCRGRYRYRPGDAAAFFAISDALDNVFEKCNITVTSATGVGHIDPYVKVMGDYNWL